MRNCPHCQFLVADGATACSVCHGDLSAPAGPAQAESSPFAAPGEAPAPAAPPQPSFSAAAYGAPGAPGAPPHGAAWPAASPGAPFPQAGVGAPPKPRWSTTRILVVVGLILLVPMLGVAGLVVIAVTGEQFAATEFSAEELAWASHEDPSGWYAVDMPGSVAVDTVEMPESFGLATSLETATVSNRDFGASVTRTPDVVPEGQTFATLPYSTTAAERSLSESGVLDDATVVGHDVVPGTGDLELAVEVRGTVGGEDGVMWSRLVIVGTDLYELNAVGSVENSDETSAILERMTSSFSPT